MGWAVATVFGNTSSNLPSMIWNTAGKARWFCPAKRWTRPHRPALTLAACLDELQSQAGRRYDARVVKSCVKLLRDGQATAGDIRALVETARRAVRDKFGVELRDEVVFLGEF